MAYDQVLESSQKGTSNISSRKADVPLLHVNLVQILRSASPAIMDYTAYITAMVFIL